MQACDILIVGAGTAGIPAAIFAARAGASVIVVDAADRVGGTLHLSAGQISAAGMPAQQWRGIVDSPDRHYDDIMRISRNSADPALTRLAVEQLPDMLTWLIDSGLDLPPEYPVIDRGQEPYSVARTYWHPDGGRAILAAILPQFEAERARGRIALQLGTKLRRLIVEDGRVAGIEAETGAGPRTLRARAVILTTGGFTADTRMFAQMTNGRARYGGGDAFANGDGLAASLAIGGVTANVDMFLPAFAAVEDPAARTGFAFDTRIKPGVRSPWEVYVDRDGRRFMAEDEASLNACQRALRGLRDMRFWVIWDARIAREAPPFPSRGAWTALDDRFAAGLPGYVEAGSVAGLADRIGSDPAVLAGELARYNEAIAQQRADAFGRTHRPCPIAEPPFRAVRHSGLSATGYAGLAVDGRLRVVDADRAPIPGLYAAGEIIGMATTAGASSCSGMSVGPALAFGRWLGMGIGGALAG